MPWMRALPTFVLHVVNHWFRHQNKVLVPIKEAHQKEKCR